MEQAWSSGTGDVLNDIITSKYGKRSSGYYYQKMGETCLIFQLQRGRKDRFKLRKKSVGNRYKDNS